LGPMRVIFTSVNPALVNHSMYSASVGNSIQASAKNLRQNDAEPRLNSVLSGFLLHDRTLLETPTSQTTRTHDGAWWLPKMNFASVHPEP
jgi:hypothetical protein